MMKTLVGSALVAVLALAGCGSPPPAPRPVVVAPAAGASGPAALFARVDRNNDAFIDQAEFQTLQQIRFRRLDTDGNGVLGPAEMAQAGNGPGDPGARLDANGDGAVTEAEYIGGQMALMARIDVNADGAISREEFARVAQMMAGRA